jgi:hypothetical protein
VSRRAVYALLEEYLEYREQAEVREVKYGNSDSLCASLSFAVAFARCQIDAVETGVENELQFSWSLYSLFKGQYDRSKID